MKEKDKNIITLVALLVGGIYTGIALADWIGELAWAAWIGLACLFSMIGLAARAGSYEVREKVTGTASAESQLSARAIAVKEELKKAMPSKREMEKARD